MATRSRSTTRFALLGLVVAACGGGGGDHDAGVVVPDAAPDAALTDLTCAQLEARWEVEILEIDDSCDTVADCAVAGGTVEPTCNCMGAISEHAVNFDAYQGSQALAIAREFDSRCAHDRGATTWCDTPPSDRGCNGGCYLSPNECFVVDAGP